METTIDRLGRVVIPKQAREAAQLQPGTKLDVRVVDGVVCLEPACGTFAVEKKGRFFVLKPDAPPPPLANEVVRETTSELRGARGRPPRSRKRRGS